METIHELRKWTEALTVSEKRFITLLGKARAGANSQQIELFEWLNKSGPDELPATGERFLQNLPTVSNRLKDMILDGLRLLHKEDSTEALLRTTLDEIAMLCEKKLIRAASRQLRRSKKLALETCRYAFVLQCLEWEQKLVSAANPAEVREQLAAIREEEKQMLRRYADQRELVGRHETLLALVRQHTFHRDPKILEEVVHIATHESIERCLREGAYLEHALAVNICCIRDIYERKPVAALERYRQLLGEWQQHPEWQADQTQLLLLLCKYYHTASLFSPVRSEETERYLALASEFKGLSGDAQRDFQRMSYHHRFMLAMNTGKFEAINDMIPEIENWMEAQGELLVETQVLPFLYNFTVAEFLNENFAAAGRQLRRIINTGNRKVRKDIRDFAVLLQAVVYHELGSDQLDEYLTRSGKRLFSNNGFEQDFELIVFKHLDVLARKGPSREAEKSLDRLIHELDQLAEKMKEAIPLLGMNEIRMWAHAKKNKRSLRETFLDEVRKNLKSLGQEELLA